MAKPREKRRNDYVERHAETHYRDQLGDHRVLHSKAGKIHGDAADQWLRDNDPRRQPPLTLDPDPANWLLEDVYWIDQKAGHRPNHTPCVYFIGDEERGCVKIGRSDTITGVWQRLNELQTGSPTELAIWRVVKGDRRLEAALHKHFADLRVRGEWFRLEGDLAWVTNPEGRELGAA